MGEDVKPGSCLGATGVTVAIPVYNEEQILFPNTRRLLQYLDSLTVAYQVIIGSNGSTDATVRLGEQLQQCYPGVEFFHLSTRGVGLAFQEFVVRAKFPVLVSLDMDLSANVRFIENVLALAGSHDIVVGSKKLAEQRRSIVRKKGSDAFLWCVRQLTGLPYDDYSIGAKAYSVQFLREFGTSIDDGSSYVLDLCFAARRAGRSIACVPVSCEDQRTSKFNLLEEALYKFHRLFVLWARSGVSAFSGPPEQSSDRSCSPAAR